MNTMRIASEPPEPGSHGSAENGHPIDLRHLSRQTMGDRELEAEVLRLFVREARGALDRLARQTDAGRRATAHRLKGAARGVGAFPIAATAEAIEDRPADAALLAKLAAGIAEAEDFISGLLR
jgi:HPt (histidine-containing phosphotransfer) domain-containing protein